MIAMNGLARSQNGADLIATVFAAVVVDRRHDPLTVLTAGKE